MSQSPFKRITKGNDIQLLPKSGKYDYVYIFMHGLFTSPSKYVDFFDTEDSPIPSNFKIIMPCAPVQNADFNQGRPTTSWFNISTKYGGVIYEDTINYKQLEESSNRIKAIINEEAKLLNNDFSNEKFEGYFIEKSWFMKWRESTNYNINRFLITNNQNQQSINDIKKSFKIKSKNDLKPIPVIKKFHKNSLNTSLDNN